MSEWEINKEVFISALENFFQIEKMKFKNDFRVDQTMVEKAYRIFGNQKMVDEYVFKNYPEYKPRKIEDELGVDELKMEESI